MDTLKKRADALATELIAWRRDLHRHPELGFEENRTAGFVAETLASLNIEIKTGIAETGVVGLIRGRDSKRPGVLLRADMDGLPIQEVAGREYGSCHDGVMHACGHDGHTSMLLGAATMLAESRESLDRDVVLCFQPGEEGMGGGKRMIDEGVLDWVEVGEAYALHLWTPFDAGTAHVRPGPTMAAQDEFAATLIGKGGHGALPHDAIDPIVAAAQVVGALQTVVSRSIDPLEAAVVTVGLFQAGDAPNVIPAEARMKGTLRAFDEGVRATLRARVREVVEGVGRAGGCTVDFELQKGYPAVVNDSASAANARSVAARVFGEAHVHEPAPMAAAEDFSYFLLERPGAFIFVGAGNEERGISAPHHSPEFDIDESVLPRGAELLARLALEG